MWKQERKWLEHLRQSNPFHYDRVKLDFERKWFAKFESVLDGSTHRDLVYHSLASIMQSLKGYTAFQCNRLLERKGEFWAHESYDHYVRDAEEWNRIIAYVLNNPVKARYVADWRDWKWNYRRE